VKTAGTAPRDVRVAVVIPAYDEGAFVAQVVEAVPAFIGSVIVVDDGSSDDTWERVRATGDPRVTALRHDENRGVGAAMRTGFEEALRQGVDIVVKMDGDGQMDPEKIAEFLEPLLRHEADMVKGNRYWSLASLRGMPRIRVLGNAALTFLVKLASGYWDGFDPANGYFAVRADVLRMLDLERLPRRFFFECGFLIELGILRAVVKNVPIPARYRDERSSLSVTNALLSFPPLLFWGLCRRVFWRYFVHDFTAVSVFLLLGVPAFVGGGVYGFAVWQQMEAAGRFTPAGMVMLLAMPVILGFQLILQAIVLDVSGVPSQPVSPPLRLGPWTGEALGLADAEPGSDARDAP